MKGRWRIVEDPDMRSARRRKQQGLTPLQTGTEPNKDDDVEHEDSDCDDVWGSGAMQVPTHV